MHAPAQAQVRRDTTRADSARARGDSLRRIGRDSAAVGIPLPPDSAKADSVRARQRADSIRAIELARRAADTIKAPLAHAEVPPLADIGQPYRWNRQELFASGALTLGELLGRIPGVTAFASGWIASPQVIGFGTNTGTVAAATNWDGEMEVKRVRPALAGSYAYVNPAIAVAVGAVVGGETIGAGTLVGAGLIVSAVALVVTRKR